MEELEKFARTGELLGNHIGIWAFAALLFLAVFIIVPWIRRRIASLLTRKNEGQGETSGIARKVAHALITGTRGFFVLAAALYVASQTLVLPDVATRLISGLFLVASMVQLGLWGATLVNAWVEDKFLYSKRPDPAKRSAAQLLRIMGLTLVWSVVLLLVLSNFGVDVNALLAGLGVGGIAVAFALQSVLKDLFASLSIILDKPFVVGDFIIFDEHLGTVEVIGLRTTRVRSLSGEQISVSNDALLSTRLRNFKRMSERRIVFGLHAQYGPSIDTLQAFPPYLKTIIESMDRVRFDRAHLAEFNELGVRYEAVYFVLSPEFNIHMDIQQEILVASARWFEENGLSFAQPSRRLSGELQAQPATTRTELN